MKDCIGDDGVDDGENHLAMLDDETQNAMMDLLNRIEVLVLQIQNIEKVQPTIKVDGHCIYKSSLVSQFNGNNFLSKDCLARIKHAI